MIEFRANSGKTGGHRAVAFKIDATFLSFYQTNDGDRWVQILGEEAMLTARFRLPVPSAGGRSPHTLDAIADIIDSAQTDMPRPRLVALPARKPVAATRADEEMGIALTASLAHGELRLQLCDEFGRQEDRGAAVATTIGLRECPAPVRTALRQLPHAMQLDNLAKSYSR